jgi:hypothetical protein
MSTLTQEIAEQASTLPEKEQQETLDFIEFLRSKLTKQSLNTVSETALLSESALATDWNQAEEDEAWVVLNI